MASRKIIKKLDTIFSQYIRLRDADSKGVCVCISCGNPQFWKELDCGHYVNRQHLNLRFSEVNCNAQCRKCNRFDEGNASGYTLGLIRKYGEEIINDLNLARNQIVKFSDPELESLIDYFREEVKRLKNEKGL